MNPSREYIKKLPIEERRSLAESVGVTWQFIYQIGAGIRDPHRKLALRLEIATEGKIKESDFDQEVKDEILFM